MGDYPERIPWSIAMNRVWIAVAAAALVVGLVTGINVGAQEVTDQGAESTLRVNQVLRVGDRIVTAEQLIARVWDFESSLKHEERVLTPALTYLRDATLLQIEAERLGLEILEEEVERVTQDQLDRIKEELRRRTRGAMPYEEWLPQQGLNQEDFEQYVRDRSRIILLKRILVNWFEQTHDFTEAAHIIVSQRDRANELHRRLRETAPGRLLERFEELAVQHSEDPGAGVNRGRLPILYRDCGSVVDRVHETAWKLGDMEFSEPVRVEYGERSFYHIVLRIRTFEQEAKDLADMRAELAEADDVPDDRFNRWVRWVFNTQKYPVERRLPGYDTEPDVD
jgi:hypothetical protein